MPVVRVCQATRSALESWTDRGANRCGTAGGFDDDACMGMFDWIAAAAREDTTMRPDSLTADEQRQLARLEAQVEAGVSSIMQMIEAGKALGTIRDRQLFRLSGSWEDYVSSRWKITKRRADQLIGFAGVNETLHKMGTVVPKMSERAVRPLVGMDAETVEEVISEASEDPAGVTAASIRKAVAKRKKPKATKAPRPVRLKVPGAIVVVTLNRKASAAGIDIEAALLAALDAHRQGRDGRANEAA